MMLLSLEAFAGFFAHICHHQKKYVGLLSSQQKKGVREIAPVSETRQ
jgi:hypothetical protein